MVKPTIKPVRECLGGHVVHTHRSRTHMHRAHMRRAGRRPASSLVRYTLLAPPSRLTPEEAAVLLRIPRRALRAEPEWFAPGLGEATVQPPFELRA